MRRYILSKERIKDIKIEKGFDVMIFGCGIAGLYSALHIDKKSSVALVTKGDIRKSNSWYAQGGIAAALASDDNARLHIADTLAAGAGLCDEKAVRVLADEGPDNIRELIKMGVPFDTNTEGELLITREGGHHRRRIVHCGGDATGMETTKRLGMLAEAESNIKIMTESFLADIVTDECGVTGALISDGNGLHLYPCGNIIIATGGIGQIYKYTTNPVGAVGDGIAAAMRAGATAERMEFVQFHPTTLIPHGKTERLFLISEAVRGEGGILRDSNGVAFMENVHEMKDLAPRDIVTRAILKRLEESGGENVFLDVSSIDGEFFKKRFPTIYAKCGEYGIKLTKDMIPVRPGQHYLMGGIRTDLNGKTGVNGLYACGEAASTGIHGANRLASNSMLECLVFGRRCALSINENPREIPKPKLPELTKERGKALEHLRTAELRTRIKHNMTKYAGAVRTKKGLLRCKNNISRIINETEDYELRDGYEAELYNMGQIAMTVVEGALKRKESVGAHYLVSDSEGK